LDKEGRVWHHLGKALSPANSLRTLSPSEKQVEKETLSEK
jgi:hypothetical protein